MILSLPIVGMIFRPPAIEVLNRLEFGQTLTLQRQPDNLHDPHAVQVFITGWEATYPELFAEMQARAFPDDYEVDRRSWNLCAVTDPLPLGYVGAKTGHAKQVAELLDHFGLTLAYAKLGSDLEGKPTAEFDIGQFKSENKPAFEPETEFNDEVPF